ncbi:hypothetical protein NDU88_000133 [Pleurodeles waltl]|uniref:Uncharacterized protein n=1 Tax=Pleurodeles waltl TaxID=8319 RepID=A0AAV7VSL0_PLEWA|nr:hypothetical protein NDU88_000133 [Pleurodeles waltl]
MKTAKGTPKFKYQLALRAWEEVCRTQAAAQEDDNEKNVMDNEGKEIQAEEHNFATAPQLEIKDGLLALSPEPEESGRPTK